MALISTNQAAKELGVTRTTIHRWLKGGKLQAVETVQGKRFFTPEYIEAKRKELASVDTRESA